MEGREEKGGGGEWKEERRRGEGEREGGIREEGEKGKEERETSSHVENEVNAVTGWDPLLSADPHLSCHGNTLH